MNDKLKGIIIGGVVLAALGGTLGVLKLTGADVTTDDSSSEAVSSSEVDESVKLIDVTADDIKSISVSNEYGGYTYNGASASGKDNCSITELKGLALYTRKVSDIGEDTAQLTAYKLAESGADDLNKYGLVNAAAEFDISFADGSERDFLIGDKAHQNRYRYLCEKGSNDVYMVLESTLASFLGAKEELLNTTLVESVSNDEDFQFGKLTVSRADLDYDMVFEQDSEEFSKSSSNMVSAQVMTEPIFSYLDGTNSSNIIYAMFGLTAMSAEKIFPDENDIKEYGLDEPRCVVTYEGTDGDYTLSIGGEFHDVNEDGEEQSAASAYYCTIEGVEGKDCIWKVDATALPWVTMLPTDVLTSLMTWNMVTDVTQVELSGEAANELFEISCEGEGDDAEVSKVTCNGEEIDVDTFKGLYQYILTCPTKEEIWFKDPEGEAYLTLEIRCADSADTIEFYKDTDRRDIVKLNGRTSYRIQSKWVDRLLKNVEAAKTGGEVEEDY